ncbi:hypothetical protein C8T65DRAFT_631169 [Cerioporus squamosus]|nr:hypothetical protein C8T65DRAFT_631169 [Cerioporus squamosus]
MLSLPALSELQFSTRCRDFTDWATSSLQLPNLTSLTLIDYDGHIPLPFLAAHGGRLTYLHCYPPEKSPDTWHVSSVQFGFDELSDVAPMIEHLIVCTQSVPHLLRDLSQGERSLLHLRYLDIWMRLPGLTRQRVLEESFKEYDAATGANKEKFPALGEHIRFLSYHGHSDLPKICHPSAISADDEIRALCIRDICVVQTSWCVRANEDFVELDEGLNSATAASDDEEDLEFVPEDDGEDRTSWISEDASDVGSDAGSFDNGGEESFVTLSEGEGLEELPNGLYTLPHRALLEQY